MKTLIEKKLEKKLDEKTRKLQEGKTLHFEPFGTDEEGNCLESVEIGEFVEKTDQISEDLDSDCYTGTYYDPDINVKFLDEQGIFKCLNNYTALKSLWESNVICKKKNTVTFFSKRWKETDNPKRMKKTDFHTVVNLKNENIPVEDVINKMAKHWEKAVYVSKTGIVDYVDLSKLHI